MLNLQQIKTGLILPSACTWACSIYVYTMISMCKLPPLWVYYDLYVYSSLSMCILRSLWFFISRLFLPILVLSIIGFLEIEFRLSAVSKCKFLAISDRRHFVGK